MKNKSVFFLILGVFFLLVISNTSCGTDKARKQFEIFLDRYSTQNTDNFQNTDDVILHFENNGIINASLVLEGGGLRTLYTSGVLDVFMENGLEFSCVIGVSAGALNGANYIAKHMGRSARINIMHSNDSNYFGLKQLILTGSVFNFNYLFYDPIKNLYPFAENTMINSKQKFLIGATNCETGRIVYFEKYKYDEMVQALQASSSMQLLSKPVVVDGLTYIDGAIADPVGINKAFSEGYDKIVIVLTRHLGYKSEDMSWVIKSMYKSHYKKYPELIAKLNNESTRYNSLIDEINIMESENKIFVIRPTRELNIKIAERNAQKLMDLYFLGRADAQRLLPQLSEYINGE